MDNPTVDTHIYLYGILPAEVKIPPLASIDVIYPIFSIVEDGVQAVVSQVRTSIFAVEKDEVATRKVLTRLVMNHEHIVLALLEAGAILPAAFATVLQNEEMTRVLVKQHAAEWKTILEHLEGCVEISIQASVNEPVLTKELEIATSTPITAPTSGTNYLVQRVRQVNEKNQVANHVTQILTKLHEECAKVSREQVLLPINANTVDEAGHKFYMRGCYLVERTRVAELKRIIKKHSKPTWLYLNFSKPFAPYHFSGKI